MKITTQENKIIIENPIDFNIIHILDCGQIFRYKIFDNYAVVYSLDKKCVIETMENKVVLNTEDVDYFYNFFDLDTDYSAIKSNLIKQFNLVNQVEYGYGIRILKQDPFEIILSFIISANNNIPRIKQIINRLCERYGEKCDDFYAFPKTEILFNASLEEFESLGAGYRGKYLYKTVQMIKNGDFDLALPYELNSEKAKVYIMNLYGVGPKVADCILLFAYSKNDVFPVDTWIKKVYKDEMLKENTPFNINLYLKNKYGNMSGFAQQYLFYHRRENK